jgi:sodium/hydrogen antiporter
MPLCIAAIALLAFWAGLPWIVALLLGASLAPTDPVLAADVQVGPPRSGQEDEVRFGLTSEAGLNDGLAFLLVNLAIALTAASMTGKPWLFDWLTFGVFWKIGAGVVGGWLIGRLFGGLTFRIPSDSKVASTGDGLIAIAATFVSYGATEIIYGYGFLAVCVTALTLRGAHRQHEFQREMHDVTEQGWAGSDFELRVGPDLSHLTRRCPLMAGSDKPRSLASPPSVANRTIVDLPRFVSV